MEESEQESRQLAFTPTFSIATVLTMFVAISLLVERTIHRLSNWLKKTNRKSLLEALNKMEEEMMLLGFVSLLLTATSHMIANICVPLKFTVGECGRMTLKWVHRANSMTCFVRQFWNSVNRTDYLILRKGFVTLVLLVGTKLQHVIATLALENAEITNFFSEAKLTPRDELFWFAGQFLCSYSTLPLYALVAQMGTNYKPALIPETVRETIYNWGKEARRKRRHGTINDDFELYSIRAESLAK
ncbi:unnamed protein product [Sphenostylis stenocarpa]|uniref:Uncharacterized protein n=1 Tax=Sphenostylis stenocarpa TaxID=92480 RepID=A0AA86W4R9_9FABA|nr:unnamed protein product [Sphenostylis stenocarpa]